MDAISVVVYITHYGRANGFCIYNDVAITAKYLVEKYHQRVMVIDTDAHHGDGTQWSFYTDNRIMTYSIHETGKFLFGLWSLY